MPWRERSCAIVPPAATADERAVTGESLGVTFVDRGPRRGEAGDRREGAPEMVVPPRAECDFVPPPRRSEVERSLAQVGDRRPGIPMRLRLVRHDRERLARASLGRGFVRGGRPGLGSGRHFRPGLVVLGLWQQSVGPRAAQAEQLVQPAPALGLGLSAVA